MAKSYVNSSVYQKATPRNAEIKAPRIDPVELNMKLHVALVLAILAVMVFTGS